MPATTPSWVINDQTPANPYSKSADYEAFLDYLGSLPRKLTPEIASQPLRINVSELNDHPDFKASAIGALQQWAATTGFTFEIIDDRPYDKTTDYMQVVSPELGERNDGSAFSSGRFVSIGQRFHDTEAETGPGGYIFDSFIHEFGHEFGLDHPGLYNYAGPTGSQINALNNATWIYDRQQYSVMSYFDGIDVGNPTRWSAATPMIGDIEAVMRRFFGTETQGEWTFQNVQRNTGDDTYGFGSDKLGYTLTIEGLTHDIGFVIHDTGGNDTIDFTDSTAATILDLRVGHFSSVNGHINNVAIYDGHNADGSEYLIETGIGSRFDDIIIGNAGANVLDGGTGHDRMAGLRGDDTYYVDSRRDVVFERAGGGIDTIIVTSGRYSLADAANVENILYVPKDYTYLPLPADPTPSGEGGAFGLRLQGNDLDNRLEGGDLRDLIRGGAGNDTIIGGRDTLASRDINNTIPVRRLDDKTESLDVGDDLYGGDGDDEIVAGAGNDRLIGGAGNDTLVGQAGIDVFVGGAGVDTVDYSRESPFQLIVNLRTNLANGGTGSGDTFFGIENLIGSDDRIDRFIGTAAANLFVGQGGGDVFTGGAGNDTLDGGADGDILFGGAGDDLIYGGAGQDALHGGAGVDTVSYELSAAGVRVDLGAGTASRGDAEGGVQIVGVGGVIEGDLLFDVENLTGSAFDDRLGGDAGSNILQGGAGDDTLSGGDGTDQLIGGAGLDTADFAGSTVAVLVDLAAGTGGGDSFTSIENAAGSALADTLLGSADGNILTGQGGDDSLNGGTGADTLVGDYTPVATSGVQMGSGYLTLGADATNNSADTAVDLTANFTMVDDPDIADATTVPHTSVTAIGNGQAGYYAITLNAETILTLDMDHTTQGHDTWIVLLNAAGDIVADNDDAGGDPGSDQPTDSQLTYSVLEAGTYTVLVGAYDRGFSAAVPDGAGYELNISVATIPAPPQVGVAGDDMLMGGGGDDFIFGGAGADTLAGGAGADRLKGGAGADVFVLEASADSISDFEAGLDRISLASAVMEALGSPGALLAQAFRQSAAGLATDAAQRILYSTTTGILSYDADGSGSIAALQIATLDAGLSLSAADFFVI